MEKDNQNTERGSPPMFLKYLVTLLILASLLLLHHCATFQQTGEEVQWK